MTQKFKPVPTKTLKMTVPVHINDFPLEDIPVPGTPGAKSMLVHLALTAPDGVYIRASLKAGSLQKVLAASQNAPHGGFVVVQGKLGPGLILTEAGAVFQPCAPPKVETVQTDAVAA